MNEVKSVTACYACAQGLYSECLDAVETPEGLIIPCAVRFRTAEREAGSGGGALSPKDVTDAKSTGRKRAVMLAPILTGMLCEWAGLKYAGGGVIPIVGCAGNQLADQKGGDEELGYLQGDLHHGPDKATLNNAVGTNLHRICVVCHHRWHATNDPFYGERGAAHEPFLPDPSKTDFYYLHDPNTEATPEEQETVEAWFAIRDKRKRPPYPIEIEGLRKIAP